MLYLPPGTAMPERVHGAFVSDEEVHRVVEPLKAMGPADYVDGVLDEVQTMGDGVVVGATGLPENSSAGDESDPLYDEALRVVTETRRASISGVQRRLKIGYTRAARLIEAMEAAGVVSAPEHNGDRTVLAPPPPNALALALAAVQASRPGQAAPATTPPATAPPSTRGATARRPNFSIVRYGADYQVRPDAGNVQTETYEVLLKTKASVEQFSQVRLSYSEKMETLEVLGAYTITADGQRRDVPADRIYTQESYSSASAAMYADRKVRVIVFPNLAPGPRLYYQVRRTQTTPYFPGYFGLWETFNVFTEYEDAEVTLSAPANLPMFVDSRGVQGSDRPTVKNGQAQWRWRYQRREAMPAQNWSAAGWEFGPNIMASTYRDWHWPTR
ncbi:hypothetical protein G6F31_013999 [Rhizopus arrhizus]|nr:hypothetical protein G6F31_013999 [Rhizopus arrhizus]